MNVAFFKKNIIWLLIGSVIITAILSSVFLTVEHGLSGSHKLRTLEELWHSTLHKPCDIDSAYTLISGYYNQDAVRPGGTYPSREAIYSKYDSLTHTGATCQVDLGYYITGLVYLEKGYDSLALYCLKKVNNKRLKYLNNTLGVLYTRLDITDTAEYYFLKEIHNRGNLKGAVNNLYNLYVSSANNRKRIILLENDTLFRYLYTSTQIEYVVRTHKIMPFFKIMLNERLFNVPLRIIVVSLLVAIVWFIYLLLIDIKERKHWFRLLIMFILGGAFSFLCLYVYEVISILGKWDMNNHLLNDFIYCISSIGCNEEAVKVLPVLFIALLTKWLDEPYKIIICACASALGFAYIENLSYFSNEHFGTVYARALYSVVSHMIYSSIAVYGWIVAKYQYKKPNKVFFYFLGSFFLAAFIHGLADFILIDLDAFYLGALCLFIMLISVWTSMLSNCINNSPYFSKGFTANPESLANYLLTSLTLVLLMDFLKSSYTYGAQVAVLELLNRSNIFTLFIMGSLAYNLSSLHLMKGKWFSIKFYSLDIDYRDALGVKVIITGYPRNNILDYALPMEGTIDQIVESSKKRNQWLHVQLLNPFVFNNVKVEHVLIKAKSPSKTLIDDNDILCFIQIPAKENIMVKGSFNTDDYVFPGWVVVNFIRD